MAYTEQENCLLSIIDSNIQHHNSNRRKNKITIAAYVASGNRIDVMLDGALLAGMLSVEEAYYFVFGVVAYADKTGGIKK